MSFLNHYISDPVGVFSYRSRLGAWQVAIGPEGITGAGFSDTTKAPALPSGLLRDELDRYFSTGEWKFSSRVDMDAVLGFRGSVLRALSRIPSGHVVTYGTLAAHLGRPNAARAVGGACRSNPAGILIPCHRVVAADGPGGYSGANPAWIDLKLELLRLEGALPGRGGRFETPVLLMELPV